MKKIFIFLYVVLFNFNIFTTAFDHILSGEYAFYEDHRGDMNFIRGYCIFKIEDGSAIIMVRNIDKNNNQQLNLIVEMNTDDKGLPNIKKINGLLKDTSSEFKQSYIDILNFIALYNQHKNEIKYNTKIVDPWETYNLYFIFNNIIPVFRFEKTYKDDDKEPSYFFIKGGMLNYDNFKDFFKINPESDIDNIKKMDYPAITKIEKININLNEVNLKLDKRWVSNSELGYPGYWFQFKSKRDSQIMVEKGNWQKLNSMNTKSIDEFIIKSIYSRNNILPDSIKAVENNERIEVEYKLLDDNKVLNITKLFFVSKGPDLIIINFSSFFDIYDKNKSYYKDIFDSIDIK